MGCGLARTIPNPEPVLQRLRAALGLIKAYDPVRYRRLTRDLKRVWALAVYHLPTGGFDHRLTACKLNARFVLAETTTPELIASSIVHESTHARLWGCGIGYEEEIRPRVEAICVRRELAFSTKLPDGQQVREWAEYSLASYCNHETLSKSTLAKRYDDWGVEELRRLGVPDWLVRFTFALRRVLRPSSGR